MALWPDLRRHVSPLELIERQINLIYYFWLQQWSPLFTLSKQSWAGVSVGEYAKTNLGSIGGDGGLLFAQERCQVCAFPGI